MMFRKTLASVTALFSTLVLSAAALAQESGAGLEGAVAAGGGMEQSVKWLAAGLTIALAVIACAFAQGRVIAATVEGIARNPGAQSKMFMPMILGLAIIESLAIYALVVSLLLLF
jgi:F-type H+-transporting ATPase subunit c